MNPTQSSYVHRAQRAFALPGEFAPRLLLSGAAIDYSSTFTYRIRVRSDSCTAGPRIPKFQNLQQVHFKYLLLPELPAADCNLYDHVIGQILAEIELIRGKQAIASGQFGEGARSLRHSFRPKPGVQVGLAALRLGLFPVLFGPRLQTRIRGADPD